MLLLGLRRRGHPDLKAYARFRAEIGAIHLVVRLLAVWIFLAGGQARSLEATLPMSLLQHDVQGCWTDPAFSSIGGSMIGDCLLERAMEIDAEIDLAVSRQSKAYCRPHEQAAFLEAELVWRDYRDQWCQVVADATGNTPAYVNAMACRLTLARERLGEMNFLAETGKPNCPFISLDMEESRFGNPIGTDRSITATMLAWSVEEQPPEQMDIALSMNQGQSDIARIDVSHCVFCAPEDPDCDDGLFSLKHLDAGGETEHLLFYVCSDVLGGRQLELFELSANAPPLPIWRIRDTQDFDWRLDIEQIEVRMRDGTVRAWPEEPIHTAAP